MGAGKRVYVHGELFSDILVVKLTALALARRRLRS